MQLALHNYTIRVLNTIAQLYYLAATAHGTVVTCAPGKRTCMNVSMSCEAIDERKAF